MARNVRPMMSYQYPKCIVKDSVITILCVMILTCTGTVFADDLYVSPVGDENACTVAQPCSLSYANVTATAGDTVILRGGIYSAGIKPANSGEGPGAGRIIFQAYPSERPVLKGNGDTDEDGSGVYINGKIWIKVDGVVITDCTYYMLAVVNGSRYNEIANTEIYNSTRNNNYWSYIGSTNRPSTNTWFHHNTVHDTTRADGCEDGIGLIQFGSYTVGDQESNYNTIENNFFYHGGHHTLQTYTKYNVIRNNILINPGFRPEPQGGCDTGSKYGPDPFGNFPGNGKYGHRNLEFQDPNQNRSYSLVEGNRIGYSSVNPANNGAENITLSADGFIIRYNDIWGGDGPAFLFKWGVPDHNRIYNNTIYKNGQYTGSYWPSNTPIIKDAIFLPNYQPPVKDNKFLNNLLHGNGGHDFFCGGYNLELCASYGLEIINNWCTGGNTAQCAGSGDPLFISTPAFSDSMIHSNADISPDFRLKSESGAIDKGRFLTQAVGNGSSSNTLVVDDAFYFQDGSWGSSLSDVQADWIAIGTVTNTVQISSINYASNTITLASPISWGDGDPVWLYKKTDGSIVLIGDLSDMGAHEYGAVGPSAPKNLRIVE